MATAIVSKPSSPSKWFSNKSFMKLSLPRLRPSKSNGSCPRASQTDHQLGTTTTTPILTPRKDQLREVFRYFDSDGDGKISGHELRSYFASIGEYMSHEQAQGVINDLDTDADNLIDFEDFVKLMEREGEDDEDLKRAFEMFEVEKGSGCITPKGLQRMFNRLGDERSYEECKTMIQKFDLDGNGVLDFHEFNQMMA